MKPGLHNLLVPACRFMPSVRQYTICPTRSQAADIAAAAEDRIYPDDYAPDHPVPPHAEGWNVLAGHLGADIQYMSAAPQALDYARQCTGGRKKWWS